MYGRRCLRGSLFTDVRYDDYGLGGSPMRSCESRVHAADVRADGGSGFGGEGFGQQGPQNGGNDNNGGPEDVDYEEVK